MKPGILIWLTLVMSALRVCAQSDDSEPVCKQYLQTPLPAEVQAVAQPKAWPDCDSYKSYSGLGREVDYEAARKCAWRERLAQQAGLEPRYTVGSVLGGSAMLTVLYANGEGVEQNKPLALRFGCEAQLSDQGLKDIVALRTTPHVVDKKFRYCDEAMTTFDMNFCAGYDSEIAEQKRLDQFDSLSARWAQSDKDAFKRLLRAQEEYVEAHGRRETYLGGTIRGLRVNGVEERQKDKFLAAVVEFESGHLPRGSEADFKRADADLNATYKKALELAAAQNSKEDEGLIQADGIRDAERAWLKYRDAWVVFAKMHYPHTGPNSWLTLLTRNRYWSLRMTSCEVGWSDPACKGGDKDEF